MSGITTVERADDVGMPQRHNLGSVPPYLFGIALESDVVGLQGGMLRGALKFINSPFGSFCLSKLSV